MPFVPRAACALAVLLGLLAAAAPPLAAQAVPVIETAVPFDLAGRVSVITPTLAARLRLSPPAWPVTEAFREARLYHNGLADGGHVLVVLRQDGNVARYTLSSEAVTAVRLAVSRALVAQASAGDRFIGTTTPGGTPAGTGFEVSQPAGNAFVRNQALLGLVAYGPASAALFSSTSGAAAGGAYFLAAGTSFFVAANIAKQRTVTRAQASRAAHGGSRGAITGLGLAAIADVDEAPGRGAAVLVGAIGGSIAGFQQARGLSDGEAASAGLFADLGALTTAGIGGATGAFRTRRTTQYFDPANPQFGSYTTNDNSLTGKGKATIGAAIAAQSLGYLFGPGYARRSSYNVTAGDADMVLTSAVIGAAALGTLAGPKANSPEVWGASAVGLLGGAWIADRAFVRHRDRTGAEGTIARLGAVAGALMGAGIAAMAEGEGRAAIGLASAGGLLGLLAADNIMAPAKDAGPLRGISQGTARRTDERFTLHVGPVTSMRITF